MQIEWTNKIIRIYKSDMIQVQAMPTEIWQLDIPSFRLQLKDLEDDEGICHDDTHSHNTTVEVGGAILARVVTIINDYTITFEDGQYAVNLVGANSNIGDRVNVNQVSVRSANSAGLQDLTSLQAASFGDGAVALSQTLGVAGTIFPIGTKGKPSNNWVDARVIATSQNMNKILVMGPAMVDTSEDISNLQIIGTNPMLSQLVVTEPVNAYNVYIREVYFTGFLDGNTILRECVIGETNYLGGYMEHCALTDSTITLSGIGVIMNCTAGDTATIEPIIDLTNATRLTVRNYDGDIRLVNCPNDIHIEVNMRGKLILDPTVTDGTIEIYGDCFVEDNSNGANVVDKSSSYLEEIVDGVWNKVIT